MSKLAYYERAKTALGMDELPSESALGILEKFIGAPSFLPIRDFPEVEITELVELDLVDLSSDMCSISGLGEELIETASALYVSEERPELLKKSGGSNKRELHEGMQGIFNHALEYLETKGMGVKKTTEDRSNLFIWFEKRKKGISSIEIKNKPEIRVCIRGASQETIDLFTGIGMSHRSAKNQTYFDMPQTVENTELLIDTIINFMNV